MDSEESISQRIRRLCCQIVDNEFMKPDSFSLFNDDCRHRKIIDKLDKQCFKPLCVLIDDSKQHWRNLVTETLA